MAFAVAVSVLRDPGLAQDAVQEAYLVAFRRLGDLDEPAAFLSWLRRIVITVALNMRRARRVTLLRLDDVPDVPVLDEAETRWSELQRQRLAARCSRCRATSAAVRSPLSRAVEHRAAGARRRRRRDGDAQTPAAHSRQAAEGDRDVGTARDSARQTCRRTCRRRSSSCSRGPSSPTCRRTRSARSWICCGRSFADFTRVELPEVVDLAEARKTIGRDALYVEPHELHRSTSGRILRYDLTLPLLLTVRYEGTAAAASSPRARRTALCQLDAMHLEAFHQAEVFCLDERARLDPWRMTPGAPVGRSRRCPAAGEDRADRVRDVQPGVGARSGGRRPLVRSARVGCVHRSDRRAPRRRPGVHTAIGVGYGLERLAMLRYGIDDIRKIDVSRVA